VRFDLENDHTVAVNDRLFLFCNGTLQTRSPEENIKPVTIAGSTDVDVNVGYWPVSALEI